MSIVKIVEAELKTEVREDMRAAIITASINPLAPVGIRSRTNRMKAIFVQPDLDSQISSHFLGSEHPTSFLYKTLAAIPGKTNRNRGKNLRVPANRTPPLA